MHRYYVLGTFLCLHIVSINTSYYSYYFVLLFLCTKIVYVGCQVWGKWDLSHLLLPGPQPAHLLATTVTRVENSSYWLEFKTKPGDPEPGLDLPEAAFSLPSSSSALSPVGDNWRQACFFELYSPPLLPCSL